MKNVKMTEAAVISLAETFFKNSSKRLVKGIGDDTAVLKTGGGYQLFTSDILVEGTHFLLDKISPYDLGWKAMAVNISDIAAMGGRPEAALLSLGLNEKINRQWLEKFYEGLSDCCSRYSAFIAGGDTVYAKGSLVINIALLGKTGKPVYRNRAKPGYVLLSTGELGASGAGFWAMQNSREPISAAEKYCLKKHTLPQPRVEEAEFIGSRAARLAMIDCSDGLYISCKTLCEQSGTGVELFGDNFPVSRNLKTVSRKAGKDPGEFVLYGGEDYELIIAMPGKTYERIRAEYSRNFKTGLHCIGKFTDNNNVISLSYDIPSGNKSHRILDDRSFKHF
jgi:thiamine-monophosphate kinase